MRWLALILIATLALPGAVLAGEGHYFGVSVEKHRWHSTLTAWRESRDWIERVAVRQLGVPATNVSTLTDPSWEELQAAVRELAGRVQPEDQVLFYLGTHQLKKGRVLLGDRTETTAAALGALLSEVPGRVVLLADVCYAAAIEEAAAMPASVVRVYAADAREKAPSVDLSGRFRGAVRFYSETLDAYQPAPEECSQFGMSFVDAVRAVATSDATVPINRVVETMHRRQEAFAKATRKTKTPTISGANLQSWPLRLPEPAGTRFEVGDAVTEPAPEEGESVAPVFAAIDALLAKPPAEIDPALANLLIGKIYDDGIDVAAHLATIDQLAAALRPEVAGLNNQQEVARRMATFLFAQHGFTAMPDAYNEDFLLHRLLTTKQGRCAALVSLYLALGHRLELPLHSYCVPEHVLIRTANGINVETTLRGLTLPDDRYRAMAAKTAKLSTDPFYLTLQDNRQHAATLLSPLASALREQGRLTLAAAAAERAIAINPNDAEAWNNLGMIQRRQENAVAAAKSYGEAIRIHPGFAEAWNNLGVLQLRLPDKISHFRKAVAAKPKLGVAWKNLAIAYDEAGSTQLAWAAVRQCSRLGVPLPQAFVERLRAANQ